MKRQDKKKRSIIIDKDIKALTKRSGADITQRRFSFFKQ